MEGPWVYLMKRPDGHYGVPLGIGIIPDLGAYIIVKYPAASCGVFDLRGNKIFFRAFFLSEQACPVNEYFDLFMVILYKNTGKVEKDIILWKLIKVTLKINQKDL